MAIEDIKDNKNLYLYLMQLSAALSRAESYAVDAAEFGGRIEQAKAKRWGNIFKEILPKKKKNPCRYKKDEACTTPEEEIQREKLLKFAAPFAVNAIIDIAPQVAPGSYLDAEVARKWTEFFNDYLLGLNPAYAFKVGYIILSRAPEGSSLQEVVVTTVLGAALGVLPDELRPHHINGMSGYQWALAAVEKCSEIPEDDNDRLVNIRDAWGHCWRNLASSVGVKAAEVNAKRVVARVSAKKVKDNKGMPAIANVRKILRRPAVQKLWNLRKAKRDFKVHAEGPS